MKMAEIDAVRVRRIALELIKASPEGVRTTTIADDPRLAELHAQLIEANVTTYHSLVGKILANFNRVAPIEEESPPKNDVLWRLG
jgi:hypothetical protein